MYHNILVPVVFDGDHDRWAPIKLTGVLATPSAKITFLHVIEHMPAYAVSYISDDLQKELHVALRQEMEGLAEHLPGATGQIVEGHSGRTIVEYAKQNGTDLIIIASHRPELSDYIL